MVAGAAVREWFTCSVTHETAKSYLKVATAARRAGLATDLAFRVFERAAVLLHVEHRYQFR